MLSSDIDVWDTLSQPYDYNILIRNIYFQKKKILRKTYNNWIEKISKPFSSDIDWWVNVIGERNNLNSDLFHYFCILETLNELKKKKIKIETIKVNSAHLKKIILKKNFLVRNIITEKLIKKDFLMILKIILYQIFVFILAKFYKKNVNSEISIIDYFIVGNNLSTKRYYGELEDKIKYENVFFVPTIVNTKILDLISLVKNIKYKKNFFLKESLIDISNFFQSITYFTRLKKFNKKYKNIFNYDLSEIVLDELQSLRNYNTIIISLNNYFFFKSLKRKNFKIKTSVNWFENTAVDKGWNFGLNKFFKNVNSYGYQGFTCYKDFLCLDPVKHEVQYKLIPNKIIIIGKKYFKPKIEFYNKLKILQGYAFRFDYLTKQHLKKKNLILVCLNLDKKINTDIINTIKQSQFLKNKKIIFKTHPALRINKKDFINKNYIISKESFEYLIRRSKALITAGSSSIIIESICNGVPVIVPFKDYMTQFSLEMIDLPKKLYRVSEDKKNFDKNLNYFLNKKSILTIKNINNIKKNYFNLNENNKLINFSKIF
jgi:hypothetical protein